MMAVTFSTKVSIIGTCGRSGPVERLSRALFNKMKVKALDIIEHSLRLPAKSVTLVSGGAAWADHVAVSLFLDGAVGALALHLPAALERTANGHAYVEKKGGHWSKNAGPSSNRYHKAFSRHMGYNTVDDLAVARAAGARVEVYSGFHERNAVVARSHYMIAFTWSDSDAPDDGGTKHTWSLAGEAVRRHVSLLDLDNDILAPLEAAIVDAPLSRKRKREKDPVDQECPTKLSKTIGLADVCGAHSSSHDCTYDFLPLDFWLDVVRSHVQSPS